MEQDVDEHGQCLKCIRGDHTRKEHRIAVDRVRCLARYYANLDPNNYTRGPYKKRQNANRPDRGL